jgi:hypothetical protein
MKASPLEVWKFGGASLADAGAVRRAVGLVRAHRGPLVVVVSALAGVTDALLDGARRAAAGDSKAGAAVAAAFVKRHRVLCDELLPGAASRRAFLALTPPGDRTWPPRWLPRRAAAAGRRHHARAVSGLAALVAMRSPRHGAAAVVDASVVATTAGTAATPTWS